MPVNEDGKCHCGCGMPLGECYYSKRHTVADEAEAQKEAFNQSFKVDEMKVNPGEEAQELPTFTKFLLYLAGLEIGTTLQMIDPDTKHSNVGTIRRLGFTSGEQGEEPTYYEVAWLELPPKVAQVVSEEDVKKYVLDSLKASGPSKVGEITDSWNVLSTGKVRVALDALYREGLVKLIRGARWVAVE